MRSVDSDTLDRARAGDERAFRELTEPHVRELHVHCYRVLGSLTDSDDLLQETLLAAKQRPANPRSRLTISACRTPSTSRLDR